VQTAAGINLVATLAKLLPLGAFVALAALAFQLDTGTPSATPLKSRRNVSS
jgi:amino acid transporter